MPSISPDFPGTPRPATYEDVLEAPPHKIAQIVDGTLHLLPRPTYWHANASSRIGRRIGASYDEGTGIPGGWVILAEPELHLGESGADILVPDLAGWRIGNFSEHEKVAHSGYRDVAFFTTAPDWDLRGSLAIRPRTGQVPKKRDLRPRRGALVLASRPQRPCPGSVRPPGWRMDCHFRPLWRQGGFGSALRGHLLSPVRSMFPPPQPGILRRRQFELRDRSRLTTVALVPILPGHDRSDPHIRAGASLFAEMSSSDGFSIPVKALEAPRRLAQGYRLHPRGVSKAPRPGTASSPAIKERRIRAMRAPTALPRAPNPV